MKSVWITLASSMVLAAGTAFAQLEYVADWAPNPLPTLDIDAVEKRHYIHAFDGEPKLPADYTHSPHIDPNAPNGGTLRRGALGTFDSFNQIISRGQVAAGVSLLMTRLVDSDSNDLDATYVVGAEYVQMPADRSWVLYKFRDEMAWPNGDPVTPQDYIWTVLQQFEHSSTFGPGWSDRLMAVQDLGDNRVLVRFNPDNPSRNNPVQAGIFPIYPQYHFEEPGTERSLGETFLEPFPSFGPYEISDFKQGQFIEYSLKPDWWGFDVPALKSSYSDKLIYTYYGDIEAQREAVKAGEIDLFTENSAKSWARDWENLDQIEVGDLRKEPRPKLGLQSPQMFVLNHRHAPFDDRKVRKALSYTFDFEKTNETAFFSQYTRSTSIFQNTDLQAKGMPSAAELEILNELSEKYGEEHVPSAVFGMAYQAPSTDNGAGIRGNLRKALDIFAEAGWTLNNDGQLVDQAGEQMAFEYIYRSANSARFVDPWIENVRRLGIDARARLMEPNAWWDAVRNRDFDATMLGVTSTYTGYLIYWTYGSHLKDNPQSRAWFGMDNPAVDDIGQRLLNAPTRADVNLLANVADRLLTHSHVGIFQWHLDETRLLWWNKFTEGVYQPEYGSATSGWYIDTGKESELIGRSGYSLN